MNKLSWKKCQTAYGSNSAIRLISECSNVAYFIRSRVTSTSVWSQRSCQVLFSWKVSNHKAAAWQWQKQYIPFFSTIKKTWALLRLLNASFSIFAFSSAKFLGNCLMPDINSKSKERNVGAYPRWENLISLLDEHWHMELAVDENVLSFDDMFHKMATLQMQPLVPQSSRFAESHNAKYLLLG